MLTKEVVSESMLNLDFLDEIYALPGGQEIKKCIQCGSCSGSCPVSHMMDYAPRKIFSLICSGFRDEVLGSNTIWLCSSCYSCTVRCPAGIKFTDVMYELKRLGNDYGFASRKSNTAKWPGPL